MEFRVKLNPKQKEAYKRLKFEEETEELVYGGAAGGGKSFLGCFWLTSEMIEYPGIRTFIGRKELKRLRQTTLLTLWEVFKVFDLKRDRDYNYNAMEGTVTLANGSVVQLLDLIYQPSDPLYDRFGSSEFTHGFIEEAQEIEKQCRDVLITRLRFKTKELNIKGKQLEVCNPGNNYLYTEFWEPYKKGELKPPKAFVPATVDDNKDNLSLDYINKLDNAPPEIRRRLRDGDWDFANTSNLLVIRNWIDNVLSAYIPTTGEEQYLGVDVSDEGNDSTIMAHWIMEKGIKYLVNLVKIEVAITQQTDIGGAIVEEIIKYAKQYGIGYENINIDTVGVGASARDAARRKGYFVNSYKGGEHVDKEALEEEDIAEYMNLRTYSYWQLRQAFQNNSIRIWNQLPYLDQLVRDLTGHAFTTNDKMIILEEKKAVKKKIGRSPDYGDATVIGFAPQPTSKFSFALV